MIIVCLQFMFTRHRHEPRMELQQTTSQSEDLDASNQPIRGLVWRVCGVGAQARVGSCQPPITGQYCWLLTNERAALWVWVLRRCLIVRRTESEIFHKHGQSRSDTRTNRESDTRPACDRWHPNSKSDTKREKWFKKWWSFTMCMRVTQSTRVTTSGGMMSGLQLITPRTTLRISQGGRALDS